MPASVSAGERLLVDLKMPPSKIGTYSNFTPMRVSIAGIDSWLRKALGLPKSNRNCGAVTLMGVSGKFLVLTILTQRVVHVHRFNDDHHTSNRRSGFRPSAAGVLSGRPSTRPDFWS